MKDRFLLPLGAIALLLVMFAFPAILVPNAMDDVPERASLKVLTTYDAAINMANDVISRHRNPPTTGRLAALPSDSREWIELLNPMGRKAAGGGPALLEVASDDTGAIGIAGDHLQVTITLPRYRGLQRSQTVIALTGDDGLE